MTTSPRRGLFITIEGGEGAGKSTVMAVIEQRLKASGIDLVSAREPGGTVAGEAIRGILLDTGQALCAEAELLLMFASRAQLVRERIAPALAQGIWVLSDRFTDASFAYQGGGRGLDSGLIAGLERWAVGIRPDLTFLLDVGVGRGLARARARGLDPDRIECEDEEFFQRVRTVYLARARSDPARFRVIDANRPAEMVAADVGLTLDAWLGGLQ